MVTCPVCQGTGRTTPNNNLACRECRGRGTILRGFPGGNIEVQKGVFTTLAEAQRASAGRIPEHAAMVLFGEFIPPDENMSRPIGVKFYKNDRNIALFPTPIVADAYSNIKVEHIIRDRDNKPVPVPSLQPWNVNAAANVERRNAVLPFRVKQADYTYKLLTEKDNQAPGARGTLLVNQPGGPNEIIWTATVPPGKVWHFAKCNDESMSFTADLQYGYDRIDARYRLGVAKTIHRSGTRNMAFGFGSFTENTMLDWIDDDTKTDFCEGVLAEGQLPHSRPCTPFERQIIARPGYSVYFTVQAHYRLGADISKFWLFFIEYPEENVEIIQDALKDLGYSQSIEDIANAVLAAKEREREARREFTLGSRIVMIPPEDEE